MKDEATGQRDDSPSLRDTLSSAFDAAENTEAPAAAPEPTTAGASDGSPPSSAAAAPADGSAPAATTAPATGTPAAADVPKMPPGFPGGEQAWTALAPDARGWVKNREAQVERYIRTNAEAAKFGGAMWNALRPYEATLRAQGAHPAQVVAYHMNNHHMLSQGTQTEKVAAIQAMAQQYGVELPQEWQSQDGAQPNPEVQELRNVVRGLVNHLRGGAQQQEQAAFAQANAQVAEFASGPQREHMGREDVRQIMANLIESGAAHTLEQAYDMAIWTRSDIRAVLTEKDAARKADEARTAAAATTARGGAPVAAVMQPDNQSLRGVLEAAWDAQSKRAA